MKAQERRKAILSLLSAEKEPLPGAVLADRFNVSRQIIVGDIAVLKESGNVIHSTHKGYVMQSSSLAERVFKVKHTKEQTEDELYTVVDLGGTVFDVYVWHKVYGRIEALLNIYSKAGIEKFMEGVRSGKSTELMNITGGYHYHTVRAADEATLDLIGRSLEEKGYIVSEI